MTGLPFMEFLNPDNKVIYPDGAKFPTLWPTGCKLPDDVREQVELNFANRFTCYQFPQYWLSRFWLIVMREEDKWLKLIKSEDALRPDDAIYNYDVTESENLQSDGMSSGRSSGTGESTDSADGFVADTPDNNALPIEESVTSASKNSATGKSTAMQEQSGESSNKMVRSLTRKGNIGVMTSAQIIGGYREATMYCALDEAIFPALEKLFIGVFDEEDQYGYFYSPY